ncbi:enoyl-CoA hydratase, mitochondrial-like [Brevipalpus obovatus]|uniref:enoyl-CoA hydratase, mitochondrial-like n=1 Tax=Brevipalpus obovatus TaxID=246614 RepID=UPI003D9DC0B7
MNVLSPALMHELVQALSEFRDDKQIGAVILTGSEKVFTAGADIRNMMTKKFADSYRDRFVANWEEIADFPKPLIAAVSGFVVGGGCEISMMCDIIYAGENAKFGQPEIAIGVIPGAGGTQRLTKLVGKSRAMEMVLTGKPISAQEAEHWGLVSRVFPTDKLLDEAIKLCEKICEHSKLIASIAKQSVKNSFETDLKNGLDEEKMLFYACFATEDKMEGMKAFVEKRKPIFKDS